MAFRAGRLLLVKHPFSCCIQTLLKGVIQLTINLSFDFLFSARVGHLLAYRHLYTVKPPIKDTPKEDKPPNKGQAKGTYVYTLYRKLPPKEDNLSTRVLRTSVYGTNQEIFIG